MRSKYIQSTTPGTKGKMEISYYDRKYIEHNISQKFYGMKTQEEIDLYREIIEKNLKIEFTPNESRMLEEMIKRMDNVTLCHSIENAMIIDETYDDFKSKFPESIYSKEVLMKGALFHDIGKIATPPEVLKNSVWLEREETIKLGGETYTIIRGTKPEMNIHSDSSSLVFEILDPSFSSEIFYFGNNLTEHNQIMNLIENHHIFTANYGKDINEINNENGNYNESLVYFALIDSIQAQLTIARGYKESIDIETICLNNASDLSKSTILDDLEKKEILSVFSPENLQSFRKSIIDSTIKNNPKIREEIIDERRREYIIQELSMRKFIYNNSSPKINEETKTEHLSLDYDVILWNGEPKHFSMNLDEEFLKHKNTMFAEILKIKDLEYHIGKKINFELDFSNGGCKQIINGTPQEIKIENLEKISTIEIIDWAAKEKSTIKQSTIEEELEKLRKNLTTENKSISITD